MNDLRRQHPLYIVYAFSKYLVLLIFPLLRSLLLLRGNVLAWVRGAWMDLMVVFLIVLFGVVQWSAIQYSLRLKGIYVESGFFVQKARYLPFKNLSSVTLEAPFYLRPLKIVRLRMETDGGSRSQADAVLLLRRDRADEILAACTKRLAEGEGGPKGVRTYHPRALYIAILSLITSNTLTGVLFAATFISQSGKVLGEAFEKLLMDSITRLIQILAFNLPPAAPMLAAVLLGGWGIAFLMTLVSHLGFRARREKRMLAVKVGVITKKEAYMAVERVNYVQLRQSLMTILCGFCSAFLNCTGYGKEKNEMAVLFPAVEKQDLRRTLRLILPEIKVSPRKYKPYIKVLTRFLIPPLTLMLVFAVLFGGLWYFFPGLRQLNLFFGIMAEIPAVWWLFVKIAAYFHVGIGVRGDSFTFRFTFGYAFYTVALHKDKIAKIETQQSLFQKMSKCSDVIIYPFSERQRRMRIHNIRQSEVEEFLRIFGG